MSHATPYTGLEPYGTRPPRRRGPFAFIAAVFTAWVLVLCWLALQYPAR